MVTGSVRLRSLKRLLRVVLLISALAGMIAVGLLVVDGRDDATTTVGTTVAPCLLGGGSTEPKERAAVPGVDGGVALLEDVDLGVDAGCDVVAFTFRAGTGGPGARVEYSTDVPAGPSGHPIPVAGSAFLYVRLSPAAGADIRAPDAPRTYLGPLTITPSGSSRVRQVQRVEDFEGVLLWVIGLDTAKAFTVATEVSDVATVSIRIG